MRSADLADGENADGGGASDLSAARGGGGVSPRLAESQDRVAAISGAGFEESGCEALWACLAYNLAQWVRLRWKVRLAEAQS